MGLDMYLERRTYVKNWDFMSPAERHSFVINGPEAKYIDTDKISYIVEEVGYWRKANAIHRWFVTHVQGGVDECQYSYVNAEKLEELYDTVNEVLKDPSRAPDILPTQSGFFFGDTEYGEWYMEDLKQTKEILTEILKNSDEYGPRGEFYYHSSW